jgi:hypothetical protein
MRAFADQIREFVPRRYKVLGTDGFGRSDSRDNLRRFFEVDRHYCGGGRPEALAEDGELPAAKVAEALKKYKIETERAAPWTCRSEVGGARYEVHKNQEPITGEALGRIRSKGPRHRGLQGCPRDRGAGEARDAVKKDDSLVTLESDKATMEVPAPRRGTVKEIRVKVGDKVSEGWPSSRWRRRLPRRRRSAAPTPRAAPAESPAPKSRSPASPRRAGSRPLPRRAAHRRRRRARAARAESGARRSPTRAPACAASRASSASTSRR